MLTMIFGNGTLTCTHFATIIDLFSATASSYWL